MRKSPAIPKIFSLPGGAVGAALIRLADDAGYAMACRSEHSSPRLSATAHRAVGAERAYARFAKQTIVCVSKRSRRVSVCRGRAPTWRKRTGSDLPAANCPPAADRAIDDRPYGEFGGWIEKRGPPKRGSQGDNVTLAVVVLRLTAERSDCPASGHNRSLRTGGSTISHPSVEQTPCKGRIT